MQRYSFFNLAWQGLRGNSRWQPARREPWLNGDYQVAVIGGGSMGSPRQEQPSGIFIHNL
jgi:hypothetical protein